MRNEQILKLGKHDHRLGNNSLCGIYLRFIFLLDFIGEDGDTALRCFQFHHRQQTIFQFNKFRMCSVAPDSVAP